MTQWDLCMLWNLLGPTGICWDHLHRPGPVGTHWDLLGPAMTQWDPCMLWDLLGSHTPGPTGSHWDALGALHTWGTTAGPLRLAVTGMHWCRYPPSPALPQYLHRGGPAAPLEPREEGEGGPQLAEPLLAPTGGHEQNHLESEHHTQQTGCLAISRQKEKPLWTAIKRHQKQIAEPVEVLEIHLNNWQGHSEARL